MSISLATQLHHEVLLSLAEEIGQTVNWLSEHEIPPPVEQVRVRIQTLREAATIAGMNSIEGILDELDRTLVSQGKLKPLDQVEQSNHVLHGLSDLITSLVKSAEEKELAWIEQINTAETKLLHVASELNRYVNRLSEKIMLIDAIAAAQSSQERSRLLAQLGKQLKKESDQQRTCYSRIQDIRANLSKALRLMVNELSGIHGVEIATSLAHLPELARDYGRNKSRPVSLLTRFGNIKVSTRQLEPLSRVLEFLVSDILENSLQSPRERKKAGKATVGNIRLSAERDSNLLQIVIEDDGLTQRPGLKLTQQVTHDLSALKSRLLSEGATDHSRCIRLQVPVWHSTCEVILVESAVGQVLVPLSIVAEVFTAKNPPDTDLQHILLARRATDDSQYENGLILKIGDWFGVIKANPIGSHFRVVPTPATDEDPDWAIAKVCDKDSQRPILHPLLFVDLKEDQQCLFPTSH
ncbi:MAG: hypothetical protein JRJ87_16115 [Deltaproteobacteria bacterium]|nr:hypothetical protein [Deltaproteobacteria bacterium]